MRPQSSLAALALGFYDGASKHLALILKDFPAHRA
jgi:hypothetical protein